MDAVFPIAQREGDAYHTLSDFTKLFDQAKSGRYLIGQGYGWHSGVHLTSKMLPWGKGLRPIQAMLDGKIVAFRIHSDYQVATYQDQEFKYSNNFILIEHEALNREDSEDVFKFYTLYMHLAPPSDIGANSSITTRYRLQEARNVRTFKHSDVPTNSGEKKQSMSKGTLLEYLYAEEKETHPYQIGKNTYKMIKCRVVENGESPSGGEKAMLNKIVWFASGLNSDFDILEDSSAVLSEPVSEPQWMSDNAAMIRDGSVVSLLPLLFREGIKVSAGEDIGYMGLHEYSNDAIGTKKDDNRVHIEMFSFEEPPEFFKKQISPKNAEQNPLVVLDGANSTGAVDMSNSFIKQLLESVTEDQVTDFSSFTARDAKVYLDGKRKHFERFIVKHPTDWHTESSQSLYESIHQTAKEALDIKCSAGFVTEEDYLNSPWRDQVMDSFDLFSQFELERADKFSWMQDLQGDLQLGSDKSLWHYWPFSLFKLSPKLVVQLGKTSEIYESGGRGPGVISSGRGDHGGKSYGVYQLSSNLKVVHRFVKNSKYRDHFGELTVGSDAFDETWKRIANSDAVGFRNAQHEFIKETHFDPLYNKLISEGIIKNTNEAAILDMIWSTSVQFGARTSLISRAVGKRTELSSREIIELVQNYKHDKTHLLFKSSPTWWGGLRQRALSEKIKLLALLDQNAIIEEN
ncbi:vgrG protein [Vibrio vulnificus]|uniref:VgrG-related protein n=1 Tax=Vibrio vulnificus TaxID=672 RepID=UPI001A1CB446|nr:vgrG protein [Vibrio vulnificus]HAU8251542.1 vgrG protein [Vibrio vulnificus]